MIGVKNSEQESTSGTRTSWIKLYLNSAIVISSPVLIWRHVIHVGHRGSCGTTHIHIAVEKAIESCFIGLTRDCTIMVYVRKALQFRKENISSWGHEVNFNYMLQSLHFRPISMISLFQGSTIQSTQSSSAAHLLSYLLINNHEVSDESYPACPYGGHLCWEISCKCKHTDIINKSIAIRNAAKRFNILMME